MSALRKTMVYLGLAEDQRRYEDDDIDAGYEDYEDYHHAEVTELAPRRQVAEVVRSAPSAGISRITTIHPRTYNEAKTIGESFRDNVPVIMNLTDMDDADAKRLVDFAAGLLIVLLTRLVLDWVQVFARSWRPRGPMLVIAETVYTLTDPPIKAVRRVLPPLRIGAVALDLGFLVVLVGVYVLLAIL